MKKMVIMIVMVMTMVACSGCNAIGKTVTTHDNRGNVTERTYNGDGELVEKMVRAED